MLILAGGKFIVANRGYGMLPILVATLHPRAPLIHLALGVSVVLELDSRLGFAMPPSACITSPVGYSDRVLYASKRRHYGWTPIRPDGRFQPGE